MQQHPNHTPNTDQHNRWSPPKALGNNIIVPRGHGPSMYCNGFGFQIQQRPATAIHFKTYSFYHNRGNIWVLNYDATRSAVGDGIDNHEHTQAHFFEDNENWTNWQPLMFNHYNNFSMACYGGERFTLLAPMADRAWMSILLPNIYHPLNASVHAGLTSELPIVLALLAFSITREYHPWLFQNGQWNRQLPYRPDLSEFLCQGFEIS